MKSAPGLGSIAGLLHEQSDGDRRAASGVENLSSLAARHFACSALVATKVEYVDVMELVDEAAAQSVGGVGVDVAAVGYVGNYATVI